MSAKAKTTISIARGTYEAGLQLAKAEERDFSFIVERALRNEAQAAGIAIDAASDIRGEVMAAAEVIGFDAAREILKRAARNQLKKRAA